jgi:hypothetical protein
VVEIVPVHGNVELPQGNFAVPLPGQLRRDAPGQMHAAGLDANQHHARGVGIAFRDGA